MILDWTGTEIRRDSGANLLYDQFIRKRAVEMMKRRLDFAPFCLTLFDANGYPVEMADHRKRIRWNTRP